MAQNILGPVEGQGINLDCYGTSRNYVVLVGQRGRVSKITDFETTRFMDSPLSILKKNIVSSKISSIRCEGQETAKTAMSGNKRKHHALSAAFKST